MLPTHRYHLLTLSTFQPHPLAAMSCLDFPPCSLTHTRTRQFLQVMDDVLVVLVSRYVVHWLLAGLGGFGGAAPFGNEEEIVCWNWKTGRVLAVSCLAKQRCLEANIQRYCLPENGWFASLALLTPTSFMVTSTSSISPIMPSEPRSVATAFPPVIQIWSFKPDPSNTINPFQPLSADYMDDTTPRPTLVAQLGLPAFAHGAVIGAFEIRPDPAFPPSKSPGCGKRKAFTQDPNKGVVVFELQVMEPGHTAFGLNPGMMSKYSYELFVLRETFVEYAKRGEERLARLWDAIAEGRAEHSWRAEELVPWAEWGEFGARMMEASMSNRVWVGVTALR